VSSIDDQINELSASELRQLFDLLRMKDSRFEKNLYDALTLIRANKRARGRG
jgi:spermidine synthase